MPSRWRVAKLLKIKKENRARPRSLGVNWHNKRALKEMPLDLELEDKVAYEVETRKPKAPSLQDIGVTFNKLKFVVLNKSVFVKTMMYWTPSRDTFWIVRYDYQHKIVQVSLQFSSRDAAMDAVRNDRVKWKFKGHLVY